jgi:hypothetical protein
MNSIFPSTIHQSWHKCPLTPNLDIYPCVDDGSDSSLMSLCPIVYLVLSGDVALDLNLYVTIS